MRQVDGVLGKIIMYGHLMIERTVLVMYRSSPLIILSVLELLHGKGHNHTLRITIEEQVLNFQKKLCAWTPG
jgi:hypothetical protein